MERKFGRVLLLGTALGLLTPSIALGAGGLWAQLQRVADNPRLREGLKNFTENVGKTVENIQKHRDEMAKWRAKQHQERRAELEALATNPKTPAWRKKAAQQALLDEDEKHRRQQEKSDAFTDKLWDSGLNITTETIQSGMKEVFAQAAHGRELEKVGLEAAQRRKAAVESTKEYIKAFTDPKVITQYVLAAGGIFALYFGLKHGITYIAEQYKKPDLADPDKTSLKFGPLNYVKTLLYGTVKDESSLSDVILKADLAEEINETTRSLKNIVANGGYFENLMLWGQPGTGKTMLAMRMARSCGLEYIYFAASNLEPFSTEEASAQLVQLFRYAQNSPNKLMIIIDEAEALLGSRARADMTDKKRTLLNLVLAYTGTESRDYMVTIMTNRPEDIDEAFLSRCGMRIQIGAPDPKERRAILQSYVDKILVSASNLKPQKPSILSAKFWFGKEEKLQPPVIEEGALSPEALDVVSDRLEGFVGRDISKLVFQIQAAAFSTEDNRVTSALINRQVDRFIKARNEKQQGFIREGTKLGAPKMGG